MDHHLHRHHQQYHHQQQQQQVVHHHSQINNPNISVSVDVTDRFPQWSLQETKELLTIRADLDQTFMETKRNKLLWEVIATGMKDKGFNRSPEQCKCKWKNLVTRYKGCETIEAESVRQQFPFYNELQVIFAARMQRMLWAEGEGGANKKKARAAEAALSSEEEEENIIMDDISEGEQKGNIGTSSSSGLKNRKLKKMKSGSSSSGGGGNLNVREVLEEFMRQQLQMEAQWREAAEARESERRAKEMEWRQAMKALENERLMMERSWREREEQRRIREEVRAEKRDALITLLLNKLTRSEGL